MYFACAITMCCNVFFYRKNMFAYRCFICFVLYVWWSTVRRIHPAVTRLTVYRRLYVWQFGDDQTVQMDIFCWNLNNFVTAKPSKSTHLFPIPSYLFPCEDNYQGVQNKSVDLACLVVWTSWSIFSSWSVWTVWSYGSFGQLDNLTCVETMCCFGDDQTRANRTKFGKNKQCGYDNTMQIETNSKI